MGCRQLDTLLFYIGISYIGDINFYKSNSISTGFVAGNYITRWSNQSVIFGKCDEKYQVLYIYILSAGIIAIILVLARIKQSLN